ncbi:hypothetical protein KAI46_06595 [bacterium]|nr:hypothetical protein [bacterium]
MKCPKCSYTSFDYLTECKKCGEILGGSRKSLNLKMGEPTLFADLDSAEKEQDSINKTSPETQSPEFQDQEQQPEESFLLGNEFSESTETITLATPEDDAASESTLDLGGLGSMNSIQPREPKGYGSKTLPENILDSPESNNLDKIQLSPLFSNTTQKTELETGDFDGLESDKLDLFSKPADVQIEPNDQLEDDIAFELSMNDSEIDLNLDTSTLETGDSQSKTLADDGLIELELDMDDDESLDDLLADLENKE